MIRPNFYRGFTRKTLKYDVDGVETELPYNTIESILDHVLQSQTLMKGNQVFYYELYQHYNIGWIKRKTDDCNHPSSREAFKIYQKEHGSRLDAGYQLVLPIIWIDHFVGEESRNKSFGSIMVSFANFSTEVSFICLLDPRIRSNFFSGPVNTRISYIGRYNTSQFERVPR